MVAVMAQRDARSLDHATLEEMRRLAVKRVLAGEPRIAVAASLQVHAGTVAKWMMRYYQAGERVYAAGVYSESELTLDYRFRLAASSRICRPSSRLMPNGFSR